jgi:hypothetical protein
MKNRNEFGGSRIIEDIRSGKLRKTSLHSLGCSEREQEDNSRYADYLYTSQYSLIRNMCQRI